MKQILIALLTTTINRYLKYAANDLSKDDVVEDLTNILDYVTDIPEESQEPITVVLNNTEVETLKSRINELEETCIANNEVIDTQFKKIKDLKDINYMWQNTCIKLREKNEKLKEMIEKAKEPERPYIDFQKIYDAAKEMEGN